MKQIVSRVNNFMLYLDQYNQIGDNNMWDDVVINPVADLPKVVSPVKVTYVDKNPMEKLSDFYNQLLRKEEDQGVDTEGSDYDDNDYDFEDGDDDLFEDNVDDEVVDGGSGKRKKAKKAKSSAGTSQGESSGPKDKTSSGSDSDLDLPDDSDGEGQVKLKFKSFNPKDLVNPTFKVGLIFSSVELLRKAITKYNLKHRVDTRMPRNDRSRVGAHCAVGCPWTLNASLDSRTKTFIVKTYVEEHNCRKECVLKRCIAKWLSEKYTETFRADSM
jgi:hypothetical protein